MPKSLQFSDILINLPFVFVQTALASQECCPFTHSLISTGKY